MNFTCSLQTLAHKNNNNGKNKSFNTFLIPKKSLRYSDEKVSFSMFDFVLVSLLVTTLQQIMYWDWLTPSLA